MKSGQMLLEPLVYNVEEVCKLLGISKPTAYKAVKGGQILSLRIGRRILIPKAALAARLAVGLPQTQSPTPEVNKPVTSKYSGCICDVCGLRVGQKGKHLIESHPEYSVRASTHFYKDEWTTKYFGEICGHDVKVYICNTCGLEIHSPAKVVEHYKKNHPKLIGKKVAL